MWTDRCSEYGPLVLPEGWEDNEGREESYPWDIGPDDVKEEEEVQGDL